MNRDAIHAVENDLPRRKLAQTISLPDANLYGPMTIYLHVLHRHPCRTSASFLSLGLHRTADLLLVDLKGIAILHVELSRNRQIWQQAIKRMRWGAEDLV